MGRGLITKCNFWLLTLLERRPPKSKRDKIVQGRI